MKYAIFLLMGLQVLLGVGLIAGFQYLASIMAFHIMDPIAYWFPIWFGSAVSGTALITLLLLWRWEGTRSRSSV